MKRIAIAIMICILAALFIVSCATTSQKPMLDPYDHLTVEAVKECSPDEAWQVSPFGLPGFIFVFQDCLKVNKLVVISVDGEEYTKEIRAASVELLAKHYIYFRNHRKDLPVAPPGESPTYSSEPGTLKWSLKKIKEEFSDGWETQFYVLSSKKVPSAQCHGSKCPRRKQ